MAEKKITTTLKANNIGPHSNLANKLHFNSLKIGVFANNGKGKTFISRMFRLVENPVSARLFAVTHERYAKL